MNIGLFTDTYYPEINGVANSVYTLKKELEERGHNVYVITTTTPGSPKHEYNVFRVHSMPFVFMKDRRVGMVYQRKLASLIRKLNLDIIHTNTEFSMRMFALIMAKELKIPLVHTYHTIYEDYTHYFAPIAILNNSAKAFARFYTRRCCNFVEEVIVPTEKVQQLLTSYNVYRNINVIPTGIELKKFYRGNYTKDQVDQVKVELGIKENEKVILYIGRVSPEKDIDKLLKILPEYKKKHDDARFVIVGAGPDIENLKNCVNELGLQDMVIFAGERPWNQIALYYQLGDVFVSASQSETQGLTYFEAMAAGLPVVAKKDDCLKDILVDGYNGYQFTTDEEFLEGLDHVLYEDKGIDYRKNSEEMMKPYSTEVFAERIEEVYHKVIESNPVWVEA
ncbi:MAG: glycosyltransferase family 4 protein [bacterium]|nr:glycosyltransferase family 4 protein [bacterium]